MVGLNGDWNIPVISSLSLLAFVGVACWDRGLLLLGEGLEIAPGTVVGLNGDWNVPLIGGFALLALK